MRFPRSGPPLAGLRPGSSRVILLMDIHPGYASPGKNAGYRHPSPGGSPALAAAGAALLGAATVLLMTLGGRPRRRRSA
jgi:hypothetical protein